MPEVRGFKQGKNFSLCSKGLKRSALNHGSSTLLLSETRKGRQERSRTRVETPKTLTVKKAEVRSRSVSVREASPTGEGEGSPNETSFTAKHENVFSPC